MARRQPPTASRARPAASTPVNSPSADAPTHTAPGNNTRNGSAARAAVSSRKARRVTATAIGAAAPTSTHSSAAGPPPRRPVRSSTTKTSSAPGGCPATWVAHDSGRRSMMWLVNPASMAGMLVTLGTSWRYSACGVSRVARPRDQPSTRARDRVHTRPVRYAPVMRRGQVSRAAQAGPRYTTRTATAIASGVPGPMCGSQVANSGAASAWMGTRRWLRSAPTVAATAINTAWAASTTRSAPDRCRRAATSVTGSVSVMRTGSAARRSRCGGGTRRSDAGFR